MQIGLGIGIPFKRNAILAAFNPANLFNAGEQGVWYDPSDFDRYMSQGPELVSNGDFSNGTTGWSASPSASISASNGGIRVTRATTATYPVAFQDIPLVPGRRYLIETTYNNPSGLAVFFSFGGTDQDSLGNATSGRLRLVLTASAINLRVEVGLRLTSGSVGQFIEYDNISVKELTAIDTATLFQDAAGTTPVTAVEQPVGLMLDKSKGLVLGAGLVTNGDFSNGATGWPALTFPVNDGSIVVSGGVATITAGPSTLGYAQQLSLVVGKMYRLSGLVEFVSGSGASIAITNEARNTFVVQSALVTTVGQPVRREIVFTATETNPWVYMRAGNNTSVGKFSDIQVRELPGNHAFQTTSTSRPVLSARYNLLTKTEQFDDAAWVKTNVTVSANATVAPDGTQTADALFEQAITGLHRVTEDIATVVGVSYKVLAYLKPNGRTWAVVVAGTAGNGYYFDLQNLTVGSETGGAGTVSNPSITADRNGFVLVSFNVVSTNATRGGIDIFTATGNGQVSFAGDATKGLYVWGADFRVTNDAAGQPAYQRVNTATDYDTTGFKPYLRFDGTDDWMQTNSINFTATDKMTVFAGVRKLANGTQTVYELSSNYGVNNGTFALFVDGTTPGAATIPNYFFGLNGTTGAGKTAVGYSSPVTNVISVSSDIAQATSSTEITLRVDATTPAVQESSANSSGTGNLGNYPLYIGRRGGTTLPFNGRIYGLIVRGAATDSYTIESIENYMGNKVGSVAPAIQGVPTIGVIL